MAKDALGEALYQAAVQHHQSGRLPQAENIYREILREQPRNGLVMKMLGGLLGQTGRREEAIKTMKRAADLMPKDVHVHFNLGTLYADNDQIERAIECYRETLRLKPDYAAALSRLGGALLGKAAHLEAIACYREVMRLDPRNRQAHNALILAMHCHPSFDAAAILEECRLWDRQHAEPLRKYHERHANDPNPERRLRVGYVSADFCCHSVARFMEPLLEAHDRGAVEVFCYANVKNPDPVTKRLRSLNVVWRTMNGMKEEDAAKLIRRDGVDILVDLGLHSTDNLVVFAYKPAPVQVSYLGYCSTSGLSAMDYRLSDPYLDPDSNQASDAQAYSEETVRLPETYWCYPQSYFGEAVPVVTALPAGEPAVAGRVTFGSFNSFSKISEKVLATWAKLLEALPESRLIIHAHAGDHRDHVVRAMRDMGIGTRRLEFAAHVPAFEYFQRYGQIDIALDPFPFAGGTTTCDALFMGVPVITLRGKTAVGRGGVSLLSNVGLADLVAENEAEYVEKAVALARDLPRLRDLRATLRRRMEESPLMNAPRFARNIEAACRMMWHRWCALQLDTGGQRE